MTGYEQRKEDRGHAGWRWCRPVFRATGDRNAKGQCMRWHMYKYGGMCMTTHKKTHCRTVPFSNGGQLGCQRLLCLSGSMYVNVKKLSGNTNRGEEGRRRPIQGGLIQQHLPCSAMSHIQFHDDTSSATSSNMNHFTFCHSSSVYSLCPLLITAMTSWRNIQIFSP